MEIVVNFKGGGTITLRDKNLMDSFDQDIQNYSLNGKPRFIQLEKRTFFATDTIDYFYFVEDAE